jgi:hypothetical protein
MTGPYVIRCGATGGYLATGGRIVFTKDKARGFSLRHRAEAALNKERDLVGVGNPLGWEVLPKAKAVDLSI